MNSSIVPQVPTLDLGDSTGLGWLGDELLLTQVLKVSFTSSLRSLVPCTPFTLTPWGYKTWSFNLNRTL